MANVVVSALARMDLRNIHDYIAIELSNPDAATRILAQMRSAMAGLQDYPERGKPLDAVIAAHTDYRFLICESWRIFYLYDGKTVEIIRVLHTLQDYMRVLFME